MSEKIEKEEFFSNEALQLLKNIPCLCIIADEDGRILYSNHYGLGSGFRSLEGKAIYDFTGRGSFPMQFSRLFGRIAAGTCFSEEIPMKIKGRAFPLNFILSPVRDRFGKVFMLAIASDSTGQSKPEAGSSRIYEELSDNLERLNAVQEAGKLGLWEHNAATGKTMWSDQMYRIYDVRKEGFEVSVPNIQALMGKEINEKISLEHRKKGPVNHSWSVKGRVKTAEGKIKWLKISGQSFYEKGNLVKMIGLTQDVTETSTLIELIRQTNTIAKIGGWEYNALENKLAWTDQTYEIFGEDKGTPIELAKAFDYYIEEDRKIIAGALESCISNGTEYDLQLKVRTKQGKTIWTRSIGEPIVINGEIVGAHGTFQNINKMKIAEEELVREKYRFEMIFRYIPDAVLFTDPSGTVIEANPALTRLFGYEPGQIRGADSAILFDDPYEPMAARNEQDNDETESNHIDEKIFRKRDGDTFFGQFIRNPINGGDGDTIGYISIIRDITAERSVKEQQQEYIEYIQIISVIDHLNSKSLDLKDLTDHLTVIMLDIFLTDKAYFISLDKSGTGIDKLEGVSSIEEYAGDFALADTFNRQNSAYIKELVSGQQRCHVFTAGREKKPLHFFPSNPSLSQIIRPVRVGMEGCWLLVLEQHEYERNWSKRDQELLNDIALRISAEITGKMYLKDIEQSEARFKAFSEASFESLFISQDGQIIDANKNAERLFGYSRNELLSMRISDLVASEEMEKVEKRIKDESEDPAELNEKRKDGSYFPAQVQSKMTDYNGERVRFTSIRDLTDLKLIENEVRKLNTELEEKVRDRTQKLEVTIKQLESEIETRKKTEAELQKTQKELQTALKKELELNEMKTRFVTTVSHEYRTPLTVIQTSTYLLENAFISKDEAKFASHISKIQSAISNMVNLLENVLSIGRIEAGKIEKRLSDISYTRLIKDLMRQYNATQNKELSFRFESNSEDISGQSDKTLFTQVVSNLISNAVKYSPEKGKILISLDRVDTMVEFSVSDEGIGISPEDRENLFDPFYRGRNTENISGTGLGLSITKSWVDLLEGEMNVVSDVGKGSKFIVRLPLRYASNG